jgi:hypothetical protein
MKKVIYIIIFLVLGLVVVSVFNSFGLIKQKTVAGLGQWVCTGSCRYGWINGLGQEVVIEEQACGGEGCGCRAPANSELSLLSENCEVSYVEGRGGDDLGGAGSGGSGGSGGGDEEGCSYLCGYIDDKKGWQQNSFIVTRGSSPEYYNSINYVTSYYSRFYDLSPAESRSLICSADFMNMNPIGKSRKQLSKEISNAYKFFYEEDPAGRDNQRFELGLKIGKSVNLKNFSGWFKIYLSAFMTEEVEFEGCKIGM